MTAAEKLKQTYAEFIASEETATERHDFLAGEAWAMSGGTLRHSMLASSALGLLRARLQGHPCFVFEGNARIHQQGADFSCYPDASVVCGSVRRPADDAQAIANPMVIVEVLSPSTEAYDRGEKASRYRAMPSVRELVFITQSERRVEVQRRNEHGRFELFETTTGDVELASLGVTVPLAELYADAERLAASEAT